MYKDYNMTQLTLPMETSVLIPTNDISRHVNDIIETIPRLNSMNSDIIECNIISSKMMLKVVLYAYTHLCFQDVR